MQKKKWDRSLGTSKREQGIETPKCPNKALSKLRRERLGFTGTPKKKRK